MLPYLRVHCLSISNILTFRTSHERCILGFGDGNAFMSICKLHYFGQPTNIIVSEK